MPIVSSLEVGNRMHRMVCRYLNKRKTLLGVIVLGDDLLAIGYRALTADFVVVGLEDLFEGAPCYYIFFEVKNFASPKPNQSTGGNLQQVLSLSLSLPL
jgi:hypothetical protein